MPLKLPLRHCLRHWSCSLALLPLLAAPLLAEPTVPGAEQRVNQRANSNQRRPVAAFAPSGRSLVVWDNNIVGLQARFYERDGTPSGPERTLVAHDTITTVPAVGEVTFRKDPALAMLPSGAFFLFWTEENGFLRADFFIYNYQLRSRAVFGQLFDAAGNPAGDRFRVSSLGDFKLHSAPRAAVRANDVAVVWSLEDAPNDDRAVLMRSFSHRGRAISGEVRVSPTGQPGTFPAIAADASGRFLVAWEGDDGNDRGILAQLYDVSASPLGGSFRVNSDVAGRQRRPAVAAATGNRFLVAWNGPGTERGTARIFGQMVGATGSLMGGQIAISSGSAPMELVPALAAGKSGHFLAAWLGYRSIFPVGVFAVELDADGVPVGEPVKLNRRALNANQVLSAAGDGQGRFVLPWEGFIRRQAGISMQRAAQP